MGYETKMYVGEIGGMKCGGELAICRSRIRGFQHGNAYSVYSEKDHRGRTKRFVYTDNDDRLILRNRHAEMFQFIDGTNISYFFPYAMVDLCNCGYEWPVPELISRSHKDSNLPRVLLWAGGGMCVTDSYGDAMYAIPAQEMMDAMVEASRKEPYRRYDMAIGMLQASIPHFQNLSVVNFGY